MWESQLIEKYILNAQSRSLLHVSESAGTSAAPEAITVLQTCLPSCCPQDVSSTTNPTHPSLSLVSAIAAGS